MNDEQMLLFETGKGLCLLFAVAVAATRILNCLEYVSQAFPPTAAQRARRNALNRRICSEDCRDRRELEKRKFDIIMRSLYRH